MQSLEARLQTPRTLWAALLFSVVLCDGVLVYLHKSGEIEAHSPGAALPIALAAAAIPLAIASVVLPRKGFDAALERERFAVVEEGRRVVADPRAAMARAFVLYQTPLMLGLALAESIGLLGFTLGYLGGNLMTSGIFFAVALLIMLTKYPRASTLSSAIERATKASMG